MSIYPNDENFVVYVPQFTFDDDVVAFPFKNIESSDSAVFAESISPFVFEPRTDSLSFLDNINLSVDLNLSDSLSFSDQIEPVTFSNSDSLTITDSINPIVLSGPHDHLYVADITNVSLSGFDAATFEDAPLIGIFVEDSALLSEFINSISFAKFESLLATDSLISISAIVDTFDLDQTFIEFEGFVVADPPGFDHMHWNDEFDYQFIATTLATLDDPVVSEDIPNVLIPLVDSANVNEFISLALVGAESLSAADNLLSLTISATSEDQFVYQENFELSIDINAIENISITDTALLNVNVAGQQQIAFSESTSITVFVADSAKLTEKISNSLTTSDSLHFVENKVIGATASDVAILSEFAPVSADVRKTDSLSLTERDKSIGLSSNQMSHLLEVPFYNADYARLDYLFLISEIGSASILKEDSDQFFVTELTSNIALNSLQLITFKERTGIGKSAPIVFNINNEPTVHGTASGEPVIISTSGTVPLLL